MDGGVLIFMAWRQQWVNSTTQTKRSSHAHY